MKKTIKKCAAILLSAMLLVCLAVSLSACDGNPDPDDTGTTEYTVTFDANYDGAPAATEVTVKSGEKVAEPSDPERGGYEFTGWYTDKNASSAYDFNSAVTGDITLYAGWESAGFTVTFDYNYDGAPEAEKVTVKEGDAVAAPEAPEREGWLFAGWFTDKEADDEYDFTDAVTGDITLYAGWVDAGAGLISVVFDYNYDGAPANATSYVEKGATVEERKLDDRAEKISSENGKYSYDFAETEFIGWFTDEACTSEYDFATPVNESMTLYAGWGDTTYNFEAELTNLIGKTGAGYSYGVNDEELIRVDTEFRNQGASMGYSVGYLYQPGLTVDFVIYSDRAVDNVTLTARLSAEFRDIYIAPETETVGGVNYQSFQFKVNGESVDYDPIALEDSVDQGLGNQRPFDDHEINDTVSLKEGENTITLVVNNAYPLESTILSMAPMVDCIYLTADAELSWEPLWANLDKAQVDEN